MLCTDFIIPEKLKIIFWLQFKKPTDEQRSRKL